MIKKNILMIIDSLGAGGAEKVTLNLAEAFLRENYHVDLIIIDDVIGYEVEESIDVYKLEFKKGMFDYYRNSRRLHKMVDALDKANAYEKIIVHLQKSTRLMKGYIHPNLLNVVHSTLSQASLSNRSGLRRSLKVRRLKSIYDGLNIVAVSNGIADDIRKIGIKPKTLQVIYNPVDAETLEKKASEATPCKNDNNDYIVYVGRLAESKRHDRALEAYKKSGIQASFLIVGEGDMRASIENKIEALGLKKSVQLCGFQSNPYPIIKRAKLLVLTSDYEGLPTVLIEALSLGVPVVSVDCPSGPREILVEHMSDALVDINDLDGLADAFRQQLQSPSVIPKELLERFNAKNIALAYIQG